MKIQTRHILRNHRLFQCFSVSDNSSRNMNLRIWVMIMFCWICEGKPADTEHSLHPILLSRQTQINQDLGREMKIQKTCTCPRIIKPVCGEDGKAYNNNCLAGCEDVRVECEGGCPCRPCVCPEMFQPVCGEDGVTYSNSCKAECANAMVACWDICSECA